MSNVSALVDPCPFPSDVNRKLNEKQKGFYPPTKFFFFISPNITNHKHFKTAIYAPMSDVGNIFFDEDAIYVNVPENRKQNLPLQFRFDDFFIFFFFTANLQNESVGDKMLKQLQEGQKTIDTSMQKV